MESLGGNLNPRRTRIAMRAKRTSWAPRLTFVSAFFLAPCAWGSNIRPHSPSVLNWTGPSGATGSVPWNILVLLTVLTLLPALLLAMTPFARLLIVFHFLRQALGTTSTPTNQTLIGLALILTFFLMQPVITAVHDSAIVPYEQGQVDALEAVELGAGPLRLFMLKYTREKDLALFVELAKEPRPARPEDADMRVVAPAYILSELKAGFQIGAALYLPFLVVDMVVAAITTSMGMLQLPPVVISTPLKIFLFVMVDGWNLLVGSLLKSFT
jgi:flagellar biosynthesis protein FliP